MLALAGTTLGEKGESWEEDGALRCCRTSEGGAQLPNLFIRGSCCGPEGFIPMFSAAQTAVWSFHSPVYMASLYQDAQTQGVPARGSQHCKKTSLCFWVLTHSAMVHYLWREITLISMIAEHKTSEQKSQQKILWTKMSTHFSTCLATTIGCSTWESPCCSQPWEIPCGSLLPLWWKLRVFYDNFFAVLRIKKGKS